MATTVIGAFEDSKIVRRVIDELVEAGCRGQDIEVLEGDRDEIMAVVVDRGFDEDDARGFAEAAGGGKTLVAARAPDDKADRAVAVMERHEASTEGNGRGREERVTEAEEELAVGKRKVARGGVRVATHVTERPVEETVRLRDEEVEVERRPADRKLSPEEADEAFQERTVEMTETDEEAEVRKEARVVEEVALRKRAEEHEEKVRDKVRHTEAEVEEIDGPKSARKAQ